MTMYRLPVYTKVFVYIIRLIPQHTYHRSRVIKCIEYRCKSIMQLGCSLHNLQESPPGSELGSGLLDSLF